MARITMQAFVSILAIAGGMVQRGLADADLVFDPVGYNNGSYGHDPHQYYRSTNIVSPLLLVNHWDPPRVDNASHIFLTFNDPDDGSSVGPLIYRANDLSLVYSKPRWAFATDAYVGRLNGSDYLVFLAREKPGDNLSMTCLLYDSTYTLAYNVSSPGPANASIMGVHECQLTANSSVVVILTEIIPFDLTAVGGPKEGEILDNIVQEIDIETGELLWTWRASDYHSVSDSYLEYMPGKGAFDYMHLNSAERTPEGNFLISSRHMSSITYVDRGSGEIKWTLGGKNNDFVDMSGGNATNFAWQHHARFTSDAQTQLTMFDNQNYLSNSSNFGCVEKCTRGKRVELDYDEFTARLVSEAYHPESLVTPSEGGYQILQNGNVFLGWGANPTFTEHTATGDCVLDVQLDVWRPGNAYHANYRAFKMNWKAYPTWDPEIAVDASESSGQVKVYVSWNGATEVAMWQVLVGNAQDQVTQVAITVPRAGFETEISLKHYLPFLRAAAIDVNGQVLGTTAVLELGIDGEFAGKAV